MMMMYQQSSSHQHQFPADSDFAQRLRERFIERFIIDDRLFGASNAAYWVDKTVSLVQSYVQPFQIQINNFRL